MELPNGETGRVRWQTGDQSRCHATQEANQFKERKLPYAAWDNNKYKRTVNTPTALEYELLKTKFDKQTYELEIEKKRLAKREE